MHKWQQVEWQKENLWNTEDTILQVLQCFKIKHGLQSQLCYGLCEYLLTCAFNSKKCYRMLKLLLVQKVSCITPKNSGLLWNKNIPYTNDVTINPAVLAENLLCTNTSVLKKCWIIVLFLSITITAILKHINCDLNVTFLTGIFTAGNIVFALVALEIWIQGQYENRFSLKIILPYKQLTHIIE